MNIEERKENYDSTLSQIKQRLYEWKEKKQQIQEQLEQAESRIKQLEKKMQQVTGAYELLQEIKQDQESSETENGGITDLKGQETANSDQTQFSTEKGHPNEQKKEFDG